MISQICLDLTYINNTFGIGFELHILHSVRRGRREMRKEKKDISTVVIKYEKHEI